MFTIFAIVALILAQAPKPADKPTTAKPQANTPPKPAAKPATQPVRDPEHAVFTSAFGSYYHTKKECSLFSTPEADIILMDEDKAEETLRPCPRCVGGGSAGTSAGRWRGVNAKYVPYLEKTLDRLGPLTKIERAKLTALEQIPVNKGAKPLTARQDAQTGEIKFNDGSVAFLNDDMKRIAVANQLKLVKRLNTYLELVKKGRYFEAPVFPVVPRVGDIGMFSPNAAFRIVSIGPLNSGLVELGQGDKVKRETITDIDHTGNRTTLHQKELEPQNKKPKYYWVENVSTRGWIKDDQVELEGAFEVTGTKQIQTAETGFVEVMSFKAVP